MSPFLLFAVAWSAGPCAPPCEDVAATLEEIRAISRAGRLADALTLSDEALACDELSIDERVSIHLRRASIHDRIGLHWNRRPVPESQAELDRASSLWDSASDSTRAHIELAWANWWYRAEMADRQFERSEMYARQALRRFTDLADLHGQADAVHRLGLIAFQRRELDEAREAFDRSLALEQAGGAPRPVMLGDYERHMGLVLEVSGEIAAAIPYYERSLAIRRDNGLDDQAMFAATILGAAYVRADRPAEAEAPARYAMEMADLIDSPEGWMRAGLVLGDMYAQLRNRDEARAVYEPTLMMARSIDRTSVIERVSTALAQLDGD